MGAVVSTNCVDKFATFPVFHNPVIHIIYFRDIMRFTDGYSIVHMIPTCLRYWNQDILCSPWVLCPDNLEQKDMPRPPPFSSTFPDKCIYLK